MTASELLQLARIVEDEARLLEQFIALLTEEESLLVQGQTDALLGIADQKTQIYRRLQFLHDERSRTVTRSRSGSLPAALAAAPGNTTGRWEDVLALAREARQRNTTNGKLIADRMKHNQAALTVLLAAADQPQLYGPEGHSRPTARGRPLGSV